jgi:hypothetical protein
LQRTINIFEAARELGGGFERKDPEIKPREVLDRNRPSTFI